ncbi:hypothetical protein SALBM135S_04919 [Streptomyces alboniger]
MTLRTGHHPEGVAIAREPRRTGRHDEYDRSRTRQDIVDLDRPKGMRVAAVGRFVRQGKTVATEGEATKC